MAHYRRTSTSPTNIWKVVGVVVLGVLVVALSVLAVASVKSVNPSRSPRPDPSVGFLAPRSASPSEVRPSASSSVMPSNSVQGSAALKTPAVQRFLAAGSETVVWRATRGTCVVGGTSIAPVVEVSRDAGVSWTSVSPATQQLSQVASLDVINPSVAVVVAAAQPNCTPVALRTFTLGAAWTPNAAALAAASFVSFSDPTQIVTPSGTVAAPCAEPQQIRIASTQPVVLCNGLLYAWSGQSWAASPITSVASFAVTNGGLVVAARSVAGCAGVAVARTGSVLGPLGATVACIPGVAATDDVAIDVSGGTAFVWAGSTWKAVVL